MQRKYILSLLILAVAGTAAAADWPKGFSKCADEGETCKVGSAGRLVSFGIKDQFVEKVLSGNIKCEAATFGNPAGLPSKAKKCAVGPAGAASSSSVSSSSRSSTSSVSSSTSSRSSSSTPPSSSSSSVPTGSLQSKWVGKKHPFMPNGRDPSTFNKAVAGALIAGTPAKLAEVDFGGKTIGLGCDGGDESQPAVLTLVNAKVKNVVIASAGGADGIHCGFDVYGADGKPTGEVVQGGQCILENVTWPAVCEDAASIGNGQVGTKMTIMGGSATGAGDKIFQNNGINTTIRVTRSPTTGNFKASNYGKLGRSCGDCTGNAGPRYFEVDGVTLLNKPKGGAVVQINDGIKDFPQYGADKVTVRDLTVTGKLADYKVCVVSKGGYKLRDAAGKVIKTVNSVKIGESTDPRICDISGVVAKP